MTWDFEKRELPYLWTNLKLETCNSIYQGCCLPSVFEINNLALVWEVDTSKFREYIFAISHLSPLWKRWLEFTIALGCFVPSLVKIGPVILRKKIFNFKFFILSCQICILTYKFFMETCYSFICWNINLVQFMQYK